MKSQKIILIIFLCVVIAQILAPTKMIFDQENTIKKGKAYKFLTAPIDPNDPFRGKYIRMNYEINSFKTKDSIWERNQEIFVYLKDSLGFAIIETVSKEKINIPNHFVKAKTGWYYKNSKELTFTLPFDRFYMEESKAKPAEDLVRKNRVEHLKENRTYALVYINEDKYVLDNVFINDKPIGDLVNK